MADGINFLNLGGTSAGFGQTLGTGLSQGLQHLAEAKLKQINKSKQADAYAPFVGRELASQLVNLSDKERFTVLQNLSGQSGNTGQGGSTGQEQGFNIFAKKQAPMTEYQKQMLQNQKDNVAAAERKNVILESKNNRAETERQAIKSDSFYKENIQPDFDKIESLKDTNEKLESVIKSSKGITSIDRIAELFKDSKNHFVSGFATFLQSPNAASAIKSTAQFLQQYSKTIGGGKSTQFLVEAYMKQYPDALLQDVPTVGKLAEEIIRFNNFFIERTYLKHAIFDENPNINQKGLNSELIRYSKELSEKKNEELMTDQNEDQQNNFPEVELSQDLMPQQLEQEQAHQVLQQVPQQPAQQIPQPVPQQIPQVQPQAQPQPQQTPEQMRLRQPGETLEDFFKRGKGQGNIYDDILKGNPFDISEDFTPEKRREYQEKGAKALQIVLPYYASAFGNKLNKVTRHIPEGTFKKAFESVRSTIAPTSDEAKKSLKNIGLTDEQIENPDFITKSLRDYGVPAVMIAGVVASGPVGVITAITAAAGSHALKKVSGYGGEKLDKTLGNEKGFFKDLFEVTGEIAGTIFGAKVGKAGYKAGKDYIEKNKFIKEQYKKATTKEKQDEFNLRKESGQLDQDYLDFRAAKDSKSDMFSARYDKLNENLPDQALNKEQQKNLYNLLKRYKAKLALDPNKIYEKEVAEILKAVKPVSPSTVLTDKGVPHEVEKSTKVSLKFISEKIKSLKRKLRNSDKLDPVDSDDLSNLEDTLTSFIDKHSSQSYKDLHSPLKNDYKKFKKEYTDFNLQTRKEQVPVSQAKLQLNFDEKDPKTLATFNAIDNDKSFNKILEDWGLTTGVGKVFGFIPAVIVKGAKFISDKNAITNQKINFFKEFYLEDYTDFLNKTLKQTKFPSTKNLYAALESGKKWLSNEYPDKSKDKDKKQEEYISPKPREVDLEIVKKSKKTK